MLGGAFPAAPGTGENRLNRIGNTFASSLVGVGLWLCGPGPAAGTAQAQTCTTQQNMTATDRDALADAALALAGDVKGNNAAAVKAATITEYATNFGPTEYLIRNTSAKLAGDTLRVTQAYLLDATARKAGDTSDAEFSCALKGTTSETDFTIGSLPPGRYGFVMVEATGGDHPWLLSLLLEQEGGAWKMAGLYAHARSAAGHDGLWYWTNARAKTRDKQPLLGWLYYNEANDLLQPASFLTSTNLDKLHSEQRSAAPPELADGLSAQVPLVLKGAGGAEFHVTSLTSESSDDGHTLHLVLHYAAEAGADAATTRARSEAAARALVAAHPEVKPAFDAVLVFAEVAGQNPSVVTVPMTQLP